MNRFLAFLVLALLFACNPKEEKGMDGKVVKVADGDTFTLLNPQNQQVRIRLHGIDAPEKGQDFGSVARQNLSSLVFGKTVRVQEMDVDRYGRTIAIVYTQDGICINEAMLKAGLAWHYKAYDDNAKWAAMENTARAQKQGIWSQPRPTPPWDWRKAQRAPQTKKAA